MTTTTDAPPDYNIENPHVPKTPQRQRFVPLENNPEVMTALVQKLGLSDSLSFHDIYSLDDPSLLAFVPRPVQALLLVFPTSKGYEAGRMAEDAPLAVYNGCGPEEEVLWFRQTIGNACGMMGLLHLACNGGARELIGPNTPLADLIASATPLPPIPRARLIETSTTIAEAHATAAAQGDTAAPLATDDVEHHFVSFIKSAQGNLWELDGVRKGPLNRGKLDPADDVLSEKALQLGVKRFLAMEAEQGLGADLRFSLLALAPTLD